MDEVIPDKADERAASTVGSTVTTLLPLTKPEAVKRLIFSTLMKVKLAETLPP